MDIKKLIKIQKTTVAVIGLGYVGLPLALLLSSRGFKTTGIDRDKNKIRTLEKGKLPIAQNEPGLKKLFQKSKVHFTSSLTQKTHADIFIIVVNTSVDKSNQPDNESVISAAKLVGQNIKKGNLVIVESTVAPKTTSGQIIPLLEKISNLNVNKDFFVSVVPERIRPNHVLEQLTTFSRVIGGSSKEAAEISKSFYKQITSGDLDITDTTTAETVKTVENASRDVQIAFANEMAILCEQLGVNVWEIRELVNRDPFKTMLKPGSGVGGHCLPEDPWLLYSSSKTKSKLIPLSRYINNSMPKVIFKLAQKALSESKLKVKDAKIAILGYSYVENSDDTRNSPTQTLVKILRSHETKFRIHDPFVKEFKSKSPTEIILGSDCLILMVAHNYYRKLNLADLSKLMKTKLIIDGRNFFDKKEAEKNGFIYKGIGNV